MAAVRQMAGIETPKPAAVRGRDANLLSVVENTNGAVRLGRPLQQQVIGGSRAGNGCGAESLIGWRFQ